MSCYFDFEIFLISISIQIDILQTELRSYNMVKQDRMKFEPLEG